MSQKVLVLNADYTALSLVNVPKAFLLVYLEKADLVAESDEIKLRTVSRAFPFPSVIRLHNYVKMPFKGVLLSRQNVFKRDAHQCQYCGNEHDLTLDHVYPRSRGGKTTWDNLTTACKRCNAAKGHRTPEEAKMPLCIKPYKPSFLAFIRDLSGPVEDKWVPFLAVKSKQYA
jgi:5-methylcytosine-specific restriction endonuclease McrA